LYDEIRQDVGDRKIPTVNLLPEQAKTSFDAWRAHEKRIHY